ncbi:MAG TPA: prepilin-type N-terminal cleavage/methylation domain-containing protein [Candidatus Saccharimonadales bacterium]|nr:prepilin-type N-terminal cleavage/methylation domain-containing protein [Candidatus Saccharimonadales bacterium]
MKARNQAGFTLLELIITATVAAIIIVVVIEGFTGIEQLNRTARNVTIATQLAQQQMEQIRNTPYNNIAIGTTDISSILTPYPSLGNPRSATQIVTTLDAAGLKQVDINISYTIYHRTKRVQVSTEVANIGVNK